MWQARMARWASLVPLKSDNRPMPGTLHTFVLRCVCTVCALSLRELFPRFWKNPTLVSVCT